MDTREPLLPPSLGIAGWIDRTGEMPLFCYSLPDDAELAAVFARAMDAAKESWLAEQAR